ncbi:hypothetical protein BaRGS_00001621 [Batillaria attramentaria]|uniref:Protein Njmu-R1 n=1 Tax=Batillaria attramentaria TaxID=370345 RepID=A0ABD0M8A2_9CAEN
MADESDTGSVQSSISDQSGEKKQPDSQRYYALYTFYPNRPRSVGDSSSIEGEEPSEDGSLSSTDEVTSSAACYYCVLKTSSCDDADDSKATNLRKFVVCFSVLLDPATFRKDLDSYCQGLVQLLDQETALTPQPGAESEQLSQLNTGVKTYLEGWHETVLEYLTRCVTRLGENVQYLVYSALVDATLQISGAVATDEEDIRRFISCCSLSPLLEQLQASDQQNAGISASGESWQVQPSVISLELTEQGAKFDMKGIESCNFCKVAADHLLGLDAKNVTKIRDSLESIKLAFIHNLNKLKRFLRQAELDHYALYRAFVFLKKCGAGSLLLRYVKLDASPETISVLAAIEQFIHDKQVQLT